MNQRLGSISLAGCRLISLESIPRIVGGDVDLSHCGLLSLKGLPSKIGGDLICSHNRISSIDGGPIEIDGDLYLQGNKISSLENVHKSIGKVRCIYAKGNPNLSRVLHVYFVKGCERLEIDCGDVMTIVNKHLYLGKAGLVKCQMELINSGLDKYAKM